MPFRTLLPLLMVVAPLMPAIAGEAPGRPVVIAHRGASAVLPEHTLAA